LWHLAWNLLEKQRTNSEVEHLARQALAIYRKNDHTDGALHAMWLLVLSLDGQSKLIQAEAAANEALQLARENNLRDHSAVPNILHQLAWINIRKGDFPNAERLARESVEKHLRVHGDAHPETAFGWTYLGAALHRQGKFSEAEECYRKSLDTFRRSLPENHSFMGPTFEDLIAALRSQKKYEEAISYAREAIRLQPENANVHNLLAWILCTCPNPQLRDPPEAVKLASKAVEMARLNANFWNTLGIAHYRMGNWYDSIVALRNSRVGRNGGDSNDWFFMAMAEWQRGNQDAARKWHQKAIDWMEENDPNNEELIRFRAEAVELLGVTEPQPSNP
jgi:tetratricopeptide (TPR) repeat protein